MRNQSDSFKFQRDRKGFSLAELMMAVAIIGILAGVSFISVANYLRSMTQLKRDGIAKEIFVAAQNHLTMAEGQGFLGITDFGSFLKGSDEEEGETNYFIVNSGSEISKESLLGAMLPFGAVDETVRAGGNYIIQYQKSPARVLRVYYSESEPARYPYTFGPFNKGFIAETSSKGDRWNYNGAVIGYFGADGADGAASVDVKTLLTPGIKVINAEKLMVEVTDPNVGTEYASLNITLTLYVEGVTSGNKTSIILKGQGVPTTDNPALSSTVGTSSGKYVYALDDITSSEELSFFDQFNSDGLIPGEDIKIHVEASTAVAFANIASSPEVITNSLYADDMFGSEVSSGEVPSGENGTSSKTAYIANIRHLENLDPNISGFTPENYTYTDAVQISDLNWTAFKDAIAELNDTGDNTVSIFKCGNNVLDEGTGGFFYPVCPKDGLNYNGLFDKNGEKEYYKVSDIKVKVSGNQNGNDNAGLFGKLTGGKVQNLELVDFQINEGGSGSAGALAGEASGTEFSNIVVYNTQDFDSQLKTEKQVNVTSKYGTAGGLVGKLDGKNAKISKCAAALTVSAGKDAGGLVGEAAGGTIEGCYAGGHTENGTYYKTSGENGTTPATKTPIFNVQGGEIVGGLIGKNSAAVSSSYSTCSVQGETAGGFVGDGDGQGSITDCYATGLVSGTTAGAFAGSYSGSFNNCRYLEIINEKPLPEGASGDAITGYEYLRAVGNQENENVDVTAIDVDVDSYNSFVTASRQVAKPYDSTLGELYYLTRYSQMSNNVSDDNVTAQNSEKVYVSTHYGDWPKPEILVINEQ